MVGEQLGRQIFPCGILALNQASLLLSVPTLELPLSVDGFQHLIERLVIDKTVAAVFLAETFYHFILVFVDATFQVAGHSNVDRSRLAGHDVDAVAMSFHCAPKAGPSAPHCDW